MGIFVGFNQSSWVGNKNVENSSSVFLVSVVEK